MSTLRTILPSKLTPLLSMHYPMFHGAYCPHLIYQQQTAIDGRKLESEHRDAVFFSQLIKTPNGKEWSKAKIRSHPNATICLVLLNPATNVPTISSIYINHQIGPREYAGHKDYQPRTALSSNELNTMPSTEDLFQFVVNPAHCFTHPQITILRHALIRRFPSDHPQFIQATAKLDEDSMNPVFSEFPSLPLPTQPENTSQHTQIVLTSESKPWVIPNFPDMYGITQKYRFYIQTSQKSGCIRKEVVYSQTLDKQSNMWSKPKRRTPAKSTICVLLRDNHYLSPTFGLPTYDFVDLGSKDTNPLDVYEFAMRHYFNIEQRALLTLYLSKHMGASNEQVVALLLLWSTQPPVPSV